MLGPYVDPNLLRKLFEEFKVLSKFIQECSDSVNTEQFLRLEERVDLASQTFGKLKVRVETMEQEQISLKTELEVQSSKIQKMTEKEQNKQSSSSSSSMYEIPNQHEHFIGREAELRRLRESLATAGPQLQAISGLGGVGKTSLALEFAWQEKPNFPGGVYWLTADTDRGDNILKASLFGLARKIEPKFSADTDCLLLVQIITDFLQKQQRSLLVLDNLDSEEFSPIISKIINGSWFRTSQTHILLTSRLEKKQLEEILPESNILKLDSFSKEDAMRFLNTRTKLKFDQLDVEQLVLELGHLPLALEQAAVYLRISRENITNYLKKLAQQKIKILRRKKAKPPTSETDVTKLTVETTWELNIKSIKTECPEAEKIMNVLSFMSPRCIPKRIINKGSPEVNDEELISVLKDEEEVNFLLVNLTKMSLFEEVSDSIIRVHRLVQEIIRDRLARDPDELKEALDNTQRMICHALENVQSPKSLENILKHGEDFFSSVPSLNNWSLVMENLGHFLDEMKKEEKLSDICFTNCSFLRILDDAFLYYYVLNQRDRATVYGKLLTYHMSKIKNLNFRPVYYNDSLWSTEEAERIINLMEPERVERVRDPQESRELVQKMREEGKRYLSCKKYSDAVLAFNNAVQLTADPSLQVQLKTDLCKALYFSEKFEACIEKSREVLKKDSSIPKAYFWGGVAYMKLEEKEESYPAEDRVKTGGLYGELAYTFASLCIHFSTSDEEKKKYFQIFQRSNINLCKTQVLEVSNNTELESAITKGSSERLMRATLGVGSRNVILLQPGEYNLTNLSLSMRNIIIGEFSEEKTVLKIREEYQPIVHCPNIFINLHFEVIETSIKVGSFDFVFFLDCSFKSVGTKKGMSKTQIEEKRKEIEKQMAKQIFDEAKMKRKPVLNAESQEEERMSTEKRENMQIFQENIGIEMREVRAFPPIAVCAGICVMFNCRVSDCPGGGVLVLNDSDVIMELLLYMKGCDISNCKLAGAEVRQYGNLLMEDCDIHHNLQGVSAWNFPSNVWLRNCRIFNNTNEGIHCVTGETYDSNLKVRVENSSVHHNQLGLSLEFSNYVSVKNSQIFSNGSWGIALRNSSVSIIGFNDIFRNECGGVKVMFNRFNQTLLEENKIHDHTGPGILQTVFKLASQHHTEERLLGRGRTNFDPKTNRRPILTFNNLEYNNELHYDKIKEITTFSEKTCWFCSRDNAPLKCEHCRVVYYCDRKCQKSNLSEHKPFCFFFQENKIVELKLEKWIVTPSNETIEDFTGKRPFSQNLYGKNREFLVKISCGDNNYGLDTTDSTMNILNPGLGGTCLCVYDKYRNISGVGEDERLRTIVRKLGTTNNKIILYVFLIYFQFTGRLSGEKDYNKRVYLHATLVKKDKNHFVIKVRTDEILHDQIW